MTESAGEGGGLRKFKKGRHLDVRDSPMALNILLCIIRGISNPLEIALSLNISPAGAVFHLNRLRKACLIKRVEKIGKVQRYELDYNGLVSLFTETLFKKFLETEEKVGGEPLLEEDFIFCEEFVKNLTEEKIASIKPLIEMGLKNLAESMLYGDDYPGSLMRAHTGLRNFFWMFFTAVGKVDIIYPEDNPILRSFLHWIKNKTRPQRTGEREWIEALLKLGYTSARVL
ncbi:MAG: hypothetical protein QXH67_04930 [Candidatus Bathyarchaeia archaeon]